MQRLVRYFLCLACLVGTAGCTSNQENSKLPETDSSTSRSASVKPTSAKPDIAKPKTTEEPAPEPLEENAFRVQFQTSKGDFVIAVHPDWAPRGAERFRKLVESEFYDGCRFFRVLPDFMAQFGINGDPEIHSRWKDRNIPDDPVKKSNTRGMVTFAKTNAPNSRSTQVFINFKDNSRSLDPQGFAPFGQVIEGMDVVDRINDEYREQPNQGLIQAQGNDYLNREFPNLDSIQTARIIE